MREDSRGEMHAYGPSSFWARVPALALFVFALAFGVEAARIEYAFSSDPLGPRAFPLGLALLLGGLALAWFVRPGRAEPWPRGSLLVQSVGLLALAFLSAWLFERAGFLISMALLCTGVALIFRARLWQALASGIGQALLWWLLFTYGLRIPLPTGRWFAAG